MIVQREIRRRGFFGKVFKLLFIVFNGLMAFWLISYWVTAAKMIDGYATKAEQAGGAVGATIGTSMIALLWVAGAVVLGLFTLMTRGEKILVTEDRPNL